MKYNARGTDPFQNVNTLHIYCTSEFSQNTDTELTEYDEQMVRKYIEQIKVYDEKLTVCFKAKVEIDIPR